jgi:hypothetical protein
MEGNEKTTDIVTQCGNAPSTDLPQCGKADGFSKCILANFEL